MSEPSKKQKHGSIREWRRSILGDEDADLPPNADALGDAIKDWLDLAENGRRILIENFAESCEGPGFYSLTHLLASVCDIGPTSIDPTPLTEFHSLISGIRSRQFGKSGVLPADASDDELRDAWHALRRAIAVLNRMSHAWVAIEGRASDGADDDGPVDGYRWRQGNDVIQETMAPSAWRLANYLFHAEDNTADYFTLAPIVADDHAETELDSSTCRGHRDRANEYFKRHDIPWRISLKGQPTLTPHDGTEEMPG